MAKLTKVSQKIFASTSGTDQIAEFGSKFAGTPTFTTDPGTVQALSNFLSGWFSAAIVTPNGSSPCIEDMNALFYLITFQLAYAQQAGLPEWDANTNYFTGSLTQVAGVIYVSVADNNSGNAVTNASFWTVVGGAILSAVGDIIYGGVNGAQTKLTGNTTAAKQFLTQTGTGSASAAPQWASLTAPNVQAPSGAGTYATPAGTLYIRVRGRAGGGGGGAAGTSGVNVGSAGSNTTFGPLTANGGGGGAAGSDGGLGGATNLGSFSTLGLTGDSGTAGTGNVNGCGGKGGGAGGSGGVGNGAGQTAPAGTGGGGGGAGGAPGFNGASGGGEGGFFDVIIPAPASTYSFSAGSGGAGGTASVGVNGGSGALGWIEVTAYFQ